MNPRNGKLRKPLPKPQAQRSKSHILSFHWLFRSNIPRQRTSYLSPDINKRNFFGMGDIIAVLTNVRVHLIPILSFFFNVAQPAETVRSLTESKKLLDEARKEINENRDCSQFRTKHTITRLPGFFPRNAEMLALERVLEGEPSFTILCGASSVGKVRSLSSFNPHPLYSNHIYIQTSLLREVLSREEYLVLHFDLRIAGFADLASLYLSLSQQMQQYFEEISSKMEGFEGFNKEACGFKVCPCRFDSNTLVTEIFCSMIVSTLNVESWKTMALTRSYEV